MRTEPTVTIGSNWTQCECSVDTITFIDTSKDATTIDIDWNVAVGAYNFWIRDSTIFIDAGLL